MSTSKLYTLLYSTSTYDQLLIGLADNALYEGCLNVGDTQVGFTHPTEEIFRSPETVICAVQVDPDIFNQRDCSQSSVPCSILFGLSTGSFNFKIWHEACPNEYPSILLHGAIHALFRKLSQEERLRLGPIR